MQNEGIALLYFSEFRIPKSEFISLFDKGTCEALYNADRRSRNYSLFNIHYSLKSQFNEAESNAK